MNLFLAIVAAAVLVPCAYLFALVVLSRKITPPAPGAARLRFDVIVPAHDEEAGIADTVKSLLAADYPRELFRVVVVADNCTDRTAARAAEAGATVLVRDDAALRGKGYALKLAFEQGLRGPADAFAVIDADTIVSDNLLRAFAARLEGGAAAVQADYAVRNRDASWRTRLMTIAFAIFHELRSLARERLGLSCGLRGNGMCFSRNTLTEVPHEAFSLVEDVEYGIRLGEAGHRVHYAAEAHVWGEMVSGEKASRSQRRRWEGGRIALLRAHAPRLIRRALERRDAVLADLAMDLIVPPLSILAAAVVLGGAIAALCSAGVALAIFAACAGCLFAYVLRGWWLSGTGLGGLMALCRAPIFVIWKLALAVKSAASPSHAWVRTGREHKPEEKSTPRA